MRRQKPTVKGAMIDLLSRRGYSRAQLSRKLHDKEYGEDEIVHALDEGEQNGWINDQEFALSLTRSRMNSGYGPAYISQYLKGKGVDSQIIKSVLDDESWDWWQGISRAFYKKYRQAPQDWPAKRKCQAYLYRRGFNGELIRTFLESCSAE